MARAGARGARWPLGRAGEARPATAATVAAATAATVAAATGAVVAVGVVTGVAGGLLVLVLHLVQHLAYGYGDSTFAAGVAAASPTRRVLAMAVGGAVVGLVWWALRRWVGPATSAAAAVGPSATRLRVRAVVPDAVVQVVSVGFGASLGREGAPRQVGAAFAEWLSGVLHLDERRRRTLVACGAGAGLAAVYNVPVSGAVFTLEVLLVSVAATDVLAAVLASAVATVVAWPVTGNQHAYHLTGAPDDRALVLGALVIGPVAAAVGLAFAALAERAGARRPVGWRLPVATTLTFTALGLVAVAQPLVLGNGRGPADLAFTGTTTVAAAALLLVLKPLATAACLRSGAVGGLLTPALATGALLGVLAGHAVRALAPGTSVSAFAVVTAAAVLATTQRAPLLAVVLVTELCGRTGVPVLPMVLAVAGAHLSARAWRRRWPGTAGAGATPAGSPVVGRVSAERG